MLRSCRRRGCLGNLQHRGCKILLFVGAAQLLCTTIIYYLMGFGSVDDPGFSASSHDAIIIGNNLVVQLDSPVAKTPTTTQVMSKFAKSAFSRAKTQQCKEAILETEKHQAAGFLYIQEPLIGSCSARNISKSRYIGCFRDNINIPDLDGVKTVEFVKENSARRCVEHCFSLGMPYAGLQRGVACNCGSRFGRHGALPMSRCDRPCPGNVTQKCGGNLANSVYTTEAGISLNLVAPRHPANATKMTSATQPVRIAFVLSLNGRALRQIGRLFRVIYRPEHYYYIHVDTRLKYLHAELEKMTRGVSNIYVAQGNERFSTIWGGASLLTMLLTSYQYLLSRKDWKWDFVMNLSETDFPIRPVDELALFLGANPTTNFILTHITKTDTYLSKQGMSYTFLECEHRMWRLSERQLPRGIRMFGASDWVTLTRDFVTYLINGNARSDPTLIGLLRFFNYTLLPAESYFHTVLLNTKFCDRVANSNLRVVNWQRNRGCKCQQKAIVDWCGCSPNDLLEKDFHGMEQYAASVSPSYFFARKFEESINQRILNLIEFNLLHTLSEDTKAVDFFWLNEFTLAEDGSSSGTYQKREPFYRAFAQLALSSLKPIGDEATCPKLNEITSILAATTLSIKNVFKGYLVEFKTEKHVFEVFVEASEDRRQKEEARLASLDTINNAELEKLFAQWGYRASAVQVGSDFDLKENVFRNIGSLFVTNQTGLCLAVTWEKVATARDRLTTLQVAPTNASLGASTTKKAFNADLVIVISSPDGTETTCTVIAHPADEVSCLCAEAFKLNAAGLWRLLVRSTGAKFPNVVFGDPIDFVVLPSSSAAKNVNENVALLSPAFWSLRDMCLVSSSSSDHQQSESLDPTCFAPDQSSFFEFCTTKSWSSYSADAKSLPNFSS